MATESVTTSLTVGFDVTADDEGPSSILSAEVDGREVEDGGQNLKGTSFKPGDNVAILLYRTSNVNLTTRLTSQGSLGANSFSANQDVDTFLVFDTNPTVSFSYPNPTGAGLSWLGNSLGGTTVTGFGAGLELNTIPAAEYYVGVLRAQYTASGDGLWLTNTLIGEDKYEIFCFWAGTITV